VPIRAAETDAPYYGGLSVRGLTSGAGSFRLGPVDLTVPPGRVLVVLGPSGAGKTMLLETICGLRPQLCGQIRLSGAELTGLAPERRGIGLVFQDAALFPHLSVRENVRFGPRARGRAADAATADSLLRRVGIGHLANRSPRTLSGGERQRVALARALAIRPRLLLLDEPLSALDQPTREEMRAFLQDVLADLDIPAVHVTHDRDEALSIGDDLAIIIGGRLAQAGPAGQVTAAPAGQAAARLLGWVHLGSGAIAEPGTVRAGQFTFPDVTDPQATGTVQVYYRPEDVLLDSHPNDSSGTGADGVATVIGGIVPTRPLARISLASDPPLTALVLHRDLERLQARAGDPVTAALPRASVRVFPTALEASHPGLLAPQPGTYTPPTARPAARSTRCRTFGPPVGNPGHGRSSADRGRLGLRLPPRRCEKRPRNWKPPRLRPPARPEPRGLRSARATDSRSKAPSSASGLPATRPRPLPRRQQARRLSRWPDPQAPRA